MANPDTLLATDPALQEDDIRGKVNIIEAKARDLQKQLPQAVVEAAAYCKAKKYVHPPYHQ